MKVQRRALVLRGAPVDTVVGFVAAIGLAFVSMGIVSPGLIVGWVAAVGTVTLLRLAAWWGAVSKRQGGRALRRFQLRNLVLSATAGALWGALAPICVAGGQSLQVVYPMAVALLSASSLAAGGASWKTVMAFNAPLMVALAVSYAFFAESHGLITAGMVGCYALALGFAASNLQRTVLRSIRIMTRDDSNLQLLERRLDEANEAEAQFRALIEANLDLTMIFSPDGRITYVSPSVADHLGAGPGEFIGRTTKDIIDASDLPRLQAAGARSLSQMGDSVSVPRVSFIAADGASRVLEGRISNMLYIRGVEGFVFQGRAIDKEQSIRQGDGLATRVARS